jgi:hypothetical protein
LPASDSFSKSSMRQAATTPVSGDRKGMLVTAPALITALQDPFWGRRLNFRFSD